LKLAADHCHDYIVVRGLLCRRCNLSQGFLDDAKLLKATNAYRERADAFISALPRIAKSYSLTEFLNKKFRPIDWRRCADPYEKESLLVSEIEEQISRGVKSRDIAKNLRISERVVTRLLNDERRYPDPIYYQTASIIWPNGKPNKLARIGNAEKRPTRP
jgi:hypothetical protein